MNSKPVLSPNFTIEDIRKLRDYNSIRHKSMTTEDLNKELNSNVDKFNEQINLIKQNKGIIIQNADYTKERTSNKSVMDIVNEIRNAKK
jgi:hypothetical protein